jgi:hypothetical protein
MSSRNKLFRWDRRLRYAHGLLGARSHARNGTLERPQSRANLDRSFLFSCPRHRLVFDNKTTFKLATQDDLRVPIRVLSALTASFFQFSFLLYLSSHSLGQHSPTPKDYHMAAVRSPIYLVLAFPLWTYIYSIHSPSLAPPRSPLLY